MKFGCQQILLFSLLILHSFEVIPQDLVYTGKGKFDHSHRDIILEVSPNYIYREDAFPRIAAGFNMQYFLTRYISINGYLTAGEDYAHFNIGLLGVPLLSLGGLKNYDLFAESDAGFIILLLILGSFDNLSFHIPVTSTTEISPYISFFKIQYLYQSNYPHINDFNITFCLGTRLNMYLNDKFVIAPYFEFNRLYGKGVNGFHGGIHLGYYFHTREQEYE